MRVRLGWVAICHCLFAPINCARASSLSLSLSLSFSLYLSLSLSLSFSLSRSCPLLLSINLPLIILHSQNRWISMEQVVAVTINKDSMSERSYK